MSQPQLYRRHVSPFLKSHPAFSCYCPFSQKTYEYKTTVPYYERSISLDRSSVSSSSSSGKECQIHKEIRTWTDESLSFLGSCKTLSRSNSNGRRTLLRKRIIEMSMYAIRTAIAFCLTGHEMPINFNRVIGFRCNKGTSGYLLSRQPADRNCQMAWES